MLRLPPFELRSPRSVAEAAAILDGEGPGATVVAGGTDLWPNLKRRQHDVRTVVSLMSAPELRGVGVAERGGELRLGGAEILSDLAADPLLRQRYPALAEAIGRVASPLVRNMATLGGNLCLETRCTYYNQTEEWRRSIDFCMKAQGSVCWVAPSSPRCWAHSASDTAPILCALDARARLVSAGGERTIPVADLYRNDGIDPLTKGREEIVAEVLLPAESDAGTTLSAFSKLCRRGSIDFAVLSVAVALWTGKGGVVGRAAIYLGAVASHPVPATSAATALLGKPLSPETVAEAARLARKAATPMDNTDFRVQWRGRMVEAYTAATLRQAAGLQEQAPGELP